MDIIARKRKVAKLQAQGMWNETLNALLHDAKLFGDCDLDTLCISERYWLLEERDFMKHNPGNQPNGYDKIDWMFQGVFDDLVRYAIATYREAPLFLWKIGCLISVDSVPFFHGYRASEIGNIGTGVLERAACLLKCEEYHDLVLLTNGSYAPEDKASTTKKKLYDQLASLQLQENLSDSNFHGHLCGLIEGAF